MTRNQFGKFSRPVSFRLTFVLFQGVSQAFTRDLPIVPKCLGIYQRPHHYFKISPMFKISKRVSKHLVESTLESFFITKFTESPEKGKKNSLMF